MRGALFAAAVVGARADRVALDRRRAGRADGARRGCGAAGRRRAGLVPGAAAAGAGRQPGRALHRGARAVARRSPGDARWTSSQAENAAGAAPSRCSPTRRGARRRSTSTRSCRASRCAAPGSRRRPRRWRSALVLFASRGPARQAVDAASLTLFPERVDAEVTPGNAQDQGRHAADHSSAAGRQPRAGHRAGADCRWRSAGASREMTSATRRRVPPVDAVGRRAVQIPRRRRRGDVADLRDRRGDPAARDAHRRALHLSRRAAAARRGPKTTAATSTRRPAPTCGFTCSPTARRPPAR